MQTKEKADRLYEQCVGLAGDHERERQGLLKLNEVIMGAIRAAAGQDPLAMDELEKEQQAREIHLALLECKLVADAMADWVLQLKPDEPVYAEYELPDTAQGAGLVDGPRGALGHWIRIENGVIANYQCVVPSTWNLSPRDDRDQPGPVEQALIGTQVRDEANPFEVVRIVRAFDPCLACAVHVVDARGQERARFRVL